jgi:hypothetical protein
MRRIALLILPVLIILTSVPARSTTLVRMSLDQLSQAASVIVRGRVVGQETQWNAERTRIYTLTTLEVEEAVKGSPGSTVVIQQPGGTIGNIHVFVPGTIPFRAQTEYVLFLEPAAKASRYMVVGMGQGSFLVVRSGQGKQRVAFPTGMLRLGQGQEFMGPTAPLDQFRQTVSQAVAAPVVVPRGAAIRVVIDSAQFAGSGHMQISGHTASDLFPSPALVIPAGSRVDGMARRAGEEWQVTWTGLSIRGRQVEIRGSSHFAASADWQGRSAVLEVR